VKGTNDCAIHIINRNAGDFSHFSLSENIVRVLNCILPQN